MQSAAMGGVDARDRPPPAEPGRDQAPIGAAFRPMAVEDVRGELRKMREHAANRGVVGERNVAAHWKSRGAESEPRRRFGDDVVLEPSAGRGIADNADLVAGIGLGLGKIDDMPEYAADRGAD